MWEAVATVVAGGLVGLGGTLLGRWLEVKARKDERHDEREHASFEERRQGYARLIQAMKDLQGAVGGAVVTGATVSSDTAREFTAAAAVVELSAPPEVWKRIDPAVKATTYQANGLVPGHQAEMARFLRELGADTWQRRERLYLNMVATMRADLGMTSTEAPIILETTGNDAAADTQAETSSQLPRH